MCIKYLGGRLERKSTHGTQYSMDVPDIESVAQKAKRFFIDQGKINAEKNWQWPTTVTDESPMVDGKIHPDYAFVALYTEDGEQKLHAVPKNDAIAACKSFLGQLHDTVKDGYTIEFTFKDKDHIFEFICHGEADNKGFKEHFKKNEVLTEMLNFRHGSIIGTSKCGKQLDGLSCVRGPVIVLCTDRDMEDDEEEHPIEDRIVSISDAPPLVYVLQRWIIAYKNSYLRDVKRVKQMQREKRKHEAKSAAQAGQWQW